MKNLQLALKTKWFEMTKSGVKTEDYREITPYWLKRLFKNKDYQRLDEGIIQEHVDELIMGKLDMFELETWALWIPKPFEFNIMTLGYPSSSDWERIIHLRHNGIEIRTGNPEWGAEPNKLYFVIKHGTKL